MYLFRYRSVNPHTLQELITGQIWYSKFTELNDPFEGIYINKSPDGDLQYLVNTLRLGCFSKANDNLLMWAHYADSHRGICLEYEVDTETYKSRVMHVRYEATMPVLQGIRLRPDGTLNININDEGSIFLTKSEDWAYEQECRIFIISQDSSEKGKLAKAPGSLRAIYFGLRFKVVTKQAISKALSDRPEVEFYQARLMHGQYRLGFERIERTQH